MNGPWCIGRRRRHRGDGAHGARALVAVLAVALMGGAQPPTTPEFEPSNGATPMAVGWRQKPLHDRPAGVDLEISLDQQLYEVLLPLIQEYGRKHELHITVGQGTCGISSGLLARKELDVGGYCCPPGGVDRLPDLRFHTVAIAAIALVVHPDNPIRNLTLAQARAIYAGSIYRWEQLAEDPAHAAWRGPIQPVGRLHCKQRPGHWRLLLPDEDAFGPNLVEVGAIPDMIEVVARNRYAIGYETVWMVESNRDRGRVVPISLDGVDPADAAALAARRYPLYRTYSITSWGGKAANPAVEPLVRHILDHSGKPATAFHMVGAEALHEGGWKFMDDELVGNGE